MANLAEILVLGRRRRGWSQLDLAVHAQMSVSTVSRAEQGQGLPNVNSARRLAAAIGYDADAMMQLVKEPAAKHELAWAGGVARELIAVIPGLTTGDQMGKAARVIATPTVARVPHFGGVSAVRADLRESAGLETTDVADVRVDFTVTVDGQCMEPRYDDGERVGCSVGRWQAEGFVWHKDYWIRFKDGQTTLKRVKPDTRNREKFICSPLNPKARPFSRHKGDVDSAARILFVLSG